MTASEPRKRLSRLAVAAALGLALPGAAAVSGVAGTQAPGGAPAPASFRLSDGSAGCAFDRSGSLACRRAGAQTSLVLEPDGTVHKRRADVSWTRATTVLLPGESWWNGGVSCLAGEGTVTCFAGSADSFTLR